MAWLSIIRQYLRDLGTPKGRLAWVPKWTAVRSVSNASATKLVIVIPLVGYWIIFNEHLVELAQLSTILIPDGEAQRLVPWRLFATYFGLCFVGIASILYQLFCPSQVKLYETASQYVGTVFPAISNLEMARVDDALRGGDQESKRVHAQVLEDLKLLIHGGDRDTVHSDIKRNTLQANFDFCNRRFSITRLIVAVCYASGFLILAIPSISIFLRVLSVLIHILWPVPH